jgi:hypothetical protein
MPKKEVATDTIVGKERALKIVFYDIVFAKAVLK